MTELKIAAISMLDSLHQENRLEYNEYSLLHDAVQDIDPLQDRDDELEELWAQFGDVPMNPETECIEQPFMGWVAGTHREEIWHWFDCRYSKGVASLLYGDGVDRTDQIASTVFLKQLCFECESCDCAFNHCGMCRYAMVHGLKPTITEDYGCISFEMVGVRE